VSSRVRACVPRARMEQPNGLVPVAINGSRLNPALVAPPNAYAPALVVPPDACVPTDGCEIRHTFSHV
jgi:hypothetical protein